MTIAAASLLALALFACGASPAPTATPVAPEPEPAPAPVPAPPSSSSTWEADLPAGLSGIALAPLPDGGVVVSGYRVIETGVPVAWIGRYDQGRLAWSRELVGGSHVSLLDVALAADGSIRAIGIARQPITVIDEHRDEIATITPTGAGTASGPLELALTAEGAIVSASVTTAAAAPPAEERRARGRREPRRVIVLEEIVIVDPWRVSSIARAGDSLLVSRFGALGWIDADGTARATDAQLPETGGLIDGAGAAWMATTSVASTADRAAPHTVRVARLDDAAHPAAALDLAIDAVDPALVSPAWERAPSVLLGGAAEGATIALPFASRTRCGDRELSASTVDALVLAVDAGGACAWAMSIGGAGVDLPVALDRAPDGTTALLVDVEGTDAIGALVIAGGRGLARVIVDPTGRVTSAERVSDAPAVGAAIAIGADAVFTAWGTATGDEPYPHRLARTAR